MSPVHQIKICVSGSAVLNEPAAKEKAIAVGREIAENKTVLLTGATTGYPYLAAVGAKEAGGMVIGFSPAMGIKEHTKKYRLPIDNHDLIVYTGFGYSGRNLFLIRSADIVLHVAGRTGTLNEFTAAVEDKKVIGVLMGTGGTSSLLDDVLEAAHRGANNVIFDDDPATLVTKVIERYKRENR